MLKIIGIAAVGIIALSSCKKDYNCECRTGDETAIITTHTIKGKNLVDAQTACSNKTNEYTTCNIK